MNPKPSPPTQVGLVEAPEPRSRWAMLETDADVCECSLERLNFGELIETAG